jgi:oxygen-independent coproporphyrinogen-3 oxidase
MFSLYAHIPYCQRRCPYCDFNAYAPGAWPEDRYTDALLTEIRQASTTAAWAGETVGTIFLGGGTPSLFSPASVGRILAGVTACFAVAADAEVTLEANPGTVRLDTLCGFRAAGVNRVSFGIQSLNDRHLRTLGRIHDAEAARAAVSLARDAGFDAINTDFMFGIPGQSLEDWVADLRTALALDPGHISAYNLTYEEGTAFHAWRAAGRLVPAAEDDEVAMFRETQRALSEAGYVQYEISNYARTDRACRHNITYWRRQPYLGVGAGAHSFASTAPWGHRWSNARPPGLYMDLVDRQGRAVVAEERPSRDEAIGEVLFLGLRLREGIDLGAFADAFGTPLEHARPAVRRFLDDGLLERAGPRLRLTGSGLLHADTVFAALL